MNFLISRRYMVQMAESIRKTADMLRKIETSIFFDRMLNAKRVYVAGAGRSGIIARAFALRLLHLGYDVYVVGETITPALKPGDMLVVFSGSGETHSIASICETVRETWWQCLPHHGIIRFPHEQDRGLRCESRGPHRVLPGGPFHL